MQQIDQSFIHLSTFGHHLKYHLYIHLLISSPVHKSTQKKKREKELKKKKHEKKQIQLRFSTARLAPPSLLPPLFTSSTKTHRLRVLTKLHSRQLPMLTTSITSQCPDFINLASIVGLFCITRLVLPKLTSPSQLWHILDLECLPSQQIRFGL